MPSRPQPDPFVVALGERIWFARHHREATLREDVSLADLAEDVNKLYPRGTTATQLSQYMRGRHPPSLRFLDAIAEICGVDPGWLTYGPRSKAPAPPGWDAQKSAGMPLAFGEAADEEYVPPSSRSAKRKSRKR